MIKFRISKLIVVKLIIKRYSWLNLHHINSVQKIYSSKREFSICHNLENCHIPLKQYNQCKS